MIGRHPHHRPKDRDRRFFEDRHARRTVQSRQSQNAPGFCERAGPQTERLATNPIASLSAPRFAFIRLHPAHGSRRLSAASSSVCKGYLSSQTSSIAIAVVNAVDHGHEPFDIKLRAGRPTRTSAHLAHICRHRSLGKSVTCSRARRGKLASPSQAPSNRSRGQ